VRVVKSRLQEVGSCRSDGGQEAHGILVGKPPAERSLAGLRRRKCRNIKMDLREIGCEYMN
jgi:hypothetical protein